MENSELKQASATGGLFAAAVNCMDGRVQIPVIEWMKRQYSVDYVDMITEPGPERLLADSAEATAHASIRRRLEISINRHNSRVVAIAGHHGCAGNPAAKETQLAQIRSSVRTLQSWNYQVEVVGLWVDENWKVQRIDTR